MTLELVFELFVILGDQFYVETFDGDFMTKPERSIHHPVDYVDAPATHEDEVGLYKYSSLWLEVGDVKSVWFIVKSCQEAHVVLTKYFGVPDFDSYEVRIGTKTAQ